MRRNWWLLFFSLINSAGINGYIVYKDAERPFDYGEFLLTISKKLREKGFKELHFVYFAGLPKGFQRMKWSQAPLKSLKKGTVHSRVKTTKAYYRVCLREGTRGMPANREVLMPIDHNARRPLSNVKRTTTGCDICRVPLCNNEYCWNRWHGWGGLQGLR
jgi:hypothetical protein